jgi:hypothetical protein
MREKLYGAGGDGGGATVEQWREWLEAELAPPLEGILAVHPQAVYAFRAFKEICDELLSEDFIAYKAAIRL